MAKISLKYPFKISKYAMIFLKYIKYTYFSTNICKQGVILIQTKCYIFLNDSLKILYYISYLLNMKKINHTE